MPFQVAVCGPRSCTETDAANAYKVGELLAERGAVVICGGGAGVMRAAAAGARAKGGLVVGIRPNDSREGAASDLSAVIVTNMGEARNAAIVWSADAGTFPKTDVDRAPGQRRERSFGKVSGHRGWRFLETFPKPFPAPGQVPCARLFRERFLGDAQRSGTC